MSLLREGHLTPGLPQLGPQGRGGDELADPANPSVLPGPAGRWLRWWSCGPYHLTSGGGDSGLPLVTRREHGRWAPRLPQPTREGLCYPPSRAPGPRARADWGRGSPRDSTPPLVGAASRGRSLRPAAVPLRRSAGRRFTPSGQRGAAARTRRGLLSASPCCPARRTG